MEGAEKGDERWTGRKMDASHLLSVSYFGGGGGRGAMGIRGGRRRKEESLDNQPTVQPNNHTTRQPNKN